MAWAASTEVQHGPDGVARARAWAKTQLRSRHLAGGECCDDVELIVSELVTNALQAGGHRIGLHLAAEDDELCIGVSDDAAGVVALGPPAGDHTHGRGLQIVADLAVDWGVRVEYEEKNVWATVGIPHTDGLASVDRPSYRRDVHRLFRAQGRVDDGQRRDHGLRPR